ncbi:hypothetical protein D1872_322090 [compost metagenome]
MIDLHLDAVGGKFAMLREAEGKVCVEPGGFKRVAKFTQFGEHVVKVLTHKVRQHEAIVQFGAPTTQPLRLIRLLPETGQQRPQQ